MAVISFYPDFESWDFILILICICIQLEKQMNGSMTLVRWFLYGILFTGTSEMTYPLTVHFIYSFSVKTLCRHLCFCLVSVVCLFHMVHLVVLLWSSLCLMIGLVSLFCFLFCRLIQLLCVGSFLRLMMGRGYKWWLSFCPVDLKKCSPLSFPFLREHLSMVNKSLMVF